jgi:hypothetical protein
METLVVEVPRETLRRLEIMGFMNDLNGRDVLCFLIEQGLAVLEKHRCGMCLQAMAFEQHSPGSTT